MGTATALEVSAPIIIYRSVTRDGQSFALDALSMDRLREAYGDSIHVHPRVFIAHESVADYQQLQVRLANQVVVLLTGLSEARLDVMGGVSFRDPATDAEIDLASASDAAGAVQEFG